MNNVFEIPPLPISEIIEAMKDIVVTINISNNDFQNPDPKRWWEIYSCIYSSLTSKSIEDAIQLFCHTSTSNVPYPGLHDEAMNEMGFTIFMQRVLCSCGYPNFSVQDVIEPSRKRLIKIMCAVINKIRHDIIRQDVFETIKDRCEQSQGEHDKIVNLNKELKQHWERIMKNEEQREKEISEYTEECEKLMSQIAEYHRQRDAEMRVIEEIRLGISEKNALKEKLKVEKIDVQQEHEKLSNKIVQSPDRFKQDQDRLKKKVLEQKELNDLKFKKLSGEKSITEQTTNNKNMSEKAVRLAKEVLSDVEKANELQAEMDLSDEKLQDLQDQLTALYTECDDVNENMAIRQGQKHTLTQQLDLKKKSGQQQKVHVKRNHEIYQEKLDNIKLQIAETKKKTLQIGQSTLSVDDQYQKMSDDWRKELAEIYQELDILHNCIANGCQDFKEIFQDSYY